VPQHGSVRDVLRHDLAIRQHGDALYILPILALGIAAYIIALAIAAWSGFGVEEIDVDADMIRWKRTALKWSRMRTIPISDVTEIKAITPWHGFDNTVEVTTHRERLTFGDKLLRDEATELAHRLRGAVGLLK
jgi:uncharacterized membrane protein